MYLPKSVLTGGLYGVLSRRLVNVRSGKDCPATEAFSHRRQGINEGFRHNVGLRYLQT